MIASEFKARADESKPREKMMRAPSLREISGEDLLAVLLKTGAQGCDVSALAARLLSLYGSTAAFVRAAADWRAVKERVRRHNAEHPQARILGVGDVKLLELAAAVELARRGFDAAPDDDDGAGVPLKIRSASDALRAFRVAVRGRGEQENFFVLPIDVKFTPLSDPICVTRGTVASTPVHPREVFREAVRWGAHAIFVAHNHPSGDPTPSQEDFALTERLLEVAQTVGIPLLDHIVFGTGRGAAGGFVSFRAANLVKFPGARAGG